MSNVIHVINGPNLNLLGMRPAEHYGSLKLDEILKEMEAKAKSLGLSLVHVQSNDEGKLVDAIQQVALGDAAGLVINAAAYSHTSIAIRDALECVSVPVIEVHLSNIYARDDFRHHSYVSEVVDGVISGLGPMGYLFAIEALAGAEVETETDEDV